MFDPKLTVKDENLIFYEIESDEAFNMSALSDDERKQIAQNHEQVEAGIRKYLVEMAITHACICQQSKIIQRTQRTASMIKTGQAPVLRVVQEDIDNYVFGVVVSSVDGMYREMPLCTVIWCQTCNSLQFFGDLRPLMRHLGNVYNKEMDAMSIPAGNAPAETVGNTKPKYMMKDLNTGEETAADDLAQALFGDGATPGTVTLEDVKPTVQGQVKQEPEKAD